MNEPLGNLLRRAAELQRNGRSVVACLIVKARGSTPQSAGAMMLVDDAANTWGTIGGGCVEAEVRRRAFELLNRRGSGVLKFKLDHDFGWDDGLICGGTIHLAVAPLPDADEVDAIAESIERRRPTSINLFVDDEDAGRERYTLQLPPREQLFIAGAGHVGQALARLAVNLEFAVTMFDDRADLLDRFAPPHTTTISGNIARELEGASIDDQTYCVVVTRGHRHDEQALAAVLNRGARFVGMIGSRRKVKLIFDDLREIGIDEALLTDVAAPIGLDIGSVTVEEIATSIAAQLVQIRRRDAVERVVGPFPVEAAAPDAVAAHS